MLKDKGSTNVSLNFF